MPCHVCFKWFSAPTHLIQMNGTLAGMVRSWSFAERAGSRDTTKTCQKRIHYTIADYVQYIHISYFIFPGTQTHNLRLQGQVMISLRYLQSKKPAGFTIWKQSSWQHSENWHSTEKEHLLYLPLLFWYLKMLLLPLTANEIRIELEIFKNLLSEIKPAHLTDYFSMNSGDLVS